jgi:hypothetical protein
MYLIGTAILIADLLTDCATRDLKPGSLMYFITRYAIGGLVAGTLAYVFYCACIRPWESKTKGNTAP